MAKRPGNKKSGLGEKGDLKTVFPSGRVTEDTPGRKTVHHHSRPMRHG